MGRKLESYEKDKMTFWKDKQGKELTRKEFMDRWKQGISEVTPYQQVKMQVRSTYLMIAGFIAGIIITILSIKTLWWLLLILVGGLGINISQLLAMKQKLKAFKLLEEQMQGGIKK